MKEQAAEPLIAPELSRRLGINLGGFRSVFNSSNRPDRQIRPTQRQRRFPNYLRRQHQA